MALRLMLDSNCGVETPSQFLAVIFYEQTTLIISVFAACVFIPGHFTGPFTLISYFIPEFTLIDHTS